jgi:hypothetical protein
MKLLVSSEINKDNKLTKLTVTLRPNVDNKTKPNEQEKSTTKQDNKSTQEVQAKQPQEPSKSHETTTQINQQNTTEQKSKSTQEVETEEGIVKYTIRSEEEWNQLKQKIINEVNAGKTVWIEFTKQDLIWQDLIWTAYDSFPNEEFKKVKIENILEITKE